MGMYHKLGGRNKFLWKEIERPTSRFIEILYANIFNAKHCSKYTKSAPKMKMTKSPPLMRTPVRKLLSARNRMYYLGSIVLKGKECIVIYVSHITKILERRGFWEGWFNK